MRQHYALALSNGGGSRAHRPLLGYHQPCARCGHASSLHAGVTSPKGALVQRLGGALGLMVTRKRGAYEARAGRLRPEALRALIAGRAERLQVLTARADTGMERRQERSHAGLDKWASRLAPALARGQDVAHALALGAAAASAAVMTDATQLCRVEDVMRLLPECAVTEV